MGAGARDGQAGGVEETGVISLRLCRVLLALALAASIASAGTVASKDGHDCNDAAIGWKGFEEVLAAARDSSQPICLVYYTHWCPHCKN